MTMLGGNARQSQSSASSAITTSIDAYIHWISETEGKLSKNLRQCQNKINQQDAQIKSLQNQNQQEQGLLDSKQLLNVISQAVVPGLKLCSQPTSKSGLDSKGTGFISKPYFGKPRPSQLAPGADGSLDPNLESCYCKDMGHLKDNCIKLTHWLAAGQKSDQRVAPTTHALHSSTKMAN